MAEYSIEDLKIVRYKRQTVVPNQYMPSTFGHRNIAATAHAPSPLLTGQINIPVRPVVQRAVDTFKYGGRMMKTSDEKESIFRQLFENYSSGHDVFTPAPSEESKNSKGQNSDRGINGEEVKNHTVSRDVSIRIEEELDLISFDTGSNEVSNRSIPGSKEAAGQNSLKRFFMLDKSSQSRK